MISWTKWCRMPVILFIFLFNSIYQQHPQITTFPENLDTEELIWRLDAPQEVALERLSPPSTNLSLLDVNAPVEEATTTFMNNSSKNNHLLRLRKSVIAELDGQETTQLEKKALPKKNLPKSHNVVSEQLVKPPVKEPETAKSITNLEAANEKEEFLKKYTKIVQLGTKEAFFWKGKQKNLCQKIDEEQEEGKHLLLSLTAPCDILHTQQRHGNFVLGLYAMHLAAMAHQAHFVFRCSETKPQTANIFWWLQTKNVTLTRTSSNTLYDPPLPIPEQVCKGMGKAPLQYTSELVRNDLRRMAIQIFGARDKVTTHFSEEHQLPPPLFPEEELDTVAIHFRCGDVLGNLNKKVNDNYGMVAFQAYRDRIDPQVQSIGIVTAPFDPKHLRDLDAKHHKGCKRIVNELVDYLQTSFPRATVTIRNKPSDTVPMVYSRMILAQQTFCIRSTFCLFPAIASFRTSFFQQGGVAYFVSPMADVYDNIELMEEDYLLSHQIFQLGLESTIGWLRGGNPSNSTSAMR
jgi:hypothetical protein